MTRYVGLWWGGNSYSQGEWALDAEVFESLEHAKDVLRTRDAEGWWYQPTRAAEWGEDGSARAGHELDKLRTPTVEDSELILVPLDSADLAALETDGPYACSHRLTIGPRGGVRVERL